MTHRLQLPDDGGPKINGGLELGFDQTTETLEKICPEMASNARKSKVIEQPRNKQGRFMSREMAERPRRANGQFRKKTGGRR